MTNKENVYNELLSYKIPEEDKKIIADIFIFLHKNDAQILLSELIRLYLKKIDIKRFFELCKRAVETKIKLPFIKLIDSTLNKDDLLNLTEGYICAQNENFDTDFSELEQYGKVKISLPVLIKAASQLRKEEETIELSDFKNNTAFLYKPELYIKELLRLKKSQEQVSLKQIISSKFTIPEIEEMMELSTRTKTFKNHISVHELVGLKKRGIRIKEIVNALNQAEKLQYDLSLADLTELEARGMSPGQLIEATTKPETTELKNLKVTLNAGFEVLVKAEIKTLINPDFIKKTISKERFAEESLITTQKIFSEYQDLVEAKIKRFEIESKIAEKLTENVPSHKIISFNIKDMILHQNIKAEQLKYEQEINEREAAVAEALIRKIKAEKELEELLKIYNIDQNMHSEKNSHTTNNESHSEKKTGEEEPEHKKH
jgi:uncharacterized protein YqfA (UPF0365 family)